MVVKSITILPVRFNLSDPAKSTKWNFAVSVSYCSGASESASLSTDVSWSGASLLCRSKRVNTACDREDEEFMLVAAVVLARAPARSAPNAS